MLEIAFALSSFERIISLVPLMGANMYTENYTEEIKMYQF